ncbi:MAG TPA: hypothetical protein VKV02_09315, partial [Acidobacteriaceae bacterium]|nr:hypothetical protein [Acidobacteriaceae bacterium]
MAQELLDEAADRVYNQLESVGGDPSKLPSVLKPIALLYTVQAMIDNGGFRYFFEGDMPFQPPYSVVVDAYRTIGATEAANHLETA